MLTRIYIDNYRCFQGFELSPKSLSLLIGVNGTGKSTIFEVLHKIHQLVGGYATAPQLFERDTCTRWGAKPVQTFELSFAIDEDLYTYQLRIAFSRAGRAAIDSESIVDRQGVHLYSFKKERVTIDDPSKDLMIAGGNASPLSNLPSEFRAGRLRPIIEQIVGLWSVKPIPSWIDPIAYKSDAYLNQDLSNFVSWLAYLAKDIRLIAEIQEALRETLDGFASLKFKRQGPGRALLVCWFKPHSKSAKPVQFAFNELSEGQRALIVLHTLLHYVTAKGTTLCIDEPENFLALREIQPWLNEVMLQAEDGVRQVLLISHHPKIIDFLAAEHGVLLERPAVGPVRARSIAQDRDGLSVSELVSRGWLDG